MDLIIREALRKEILPKKAGVGAGGNPKTFVRTPEHSDQSTDMKGVGG